MGAAAWDPVSAPPTLLQILPGTVIGGIERYGLTIGVAAATNGWNVHAAFPHTGDTDRLVTAFREGGVTTHAVDPRARGPSPWQVATATARTARVLAQVRPNVAHVNVPIPNFERGSLIGCALRPVPTVAVFHMAPPDRVDLGRSRRLYALLQKRSQAFVTVSEHDRAQLVRAFALSDDAVRVIPNGVAPVSSVPPSTNERTKVRYELGLDATAFVALSVGRLSTQKGYDHIVGAAAETSKRCPHVHFVIAGEGEERRALEALIDEHRLQANVHLIGQRDDVDRLLRTADVFVLPSRFEGLPFALLEAAANALPIVCSDISGVDEVVAHGDSALLHPPEDTEALARWVCYAVKHPDEMRAMGLKAQRAVKRYSREAMVETTLALLEAQAKR